MIYGCQISGQHKTNLVKPLMKWQERAIIIINFEGNNDEVNNLFAQGKILNLKIFANYRHINFVKNSIEKCGLASFNDLFIQT